VSKERNSSISLALLLHNTEYGSHSDREAALKSGLNVLALFGKRRLSEEVKSDFAKKKIQNVANKYLNQVIFPKKKKKSTGRVQMQGPV